MMQSYILEDLLRRAGQLLQADFHLRDRRERKLPVFPPDFDVIASGLATQAISKNIVYTAFDGDHQELSGLMRAAVLQHGGIPANPDSILDYKETVLAHINKEDVLLDDLAILRRCDELWVFTEEECDPTSVRHLAEGVVIELLFFLKRKRNNKVMFVSTESLLRGSGLEMKEFSFSYEETKDALGTLQAYALTISNSGLKTDSRLPSIIYFIIDPLDFKYARWLLPRAYQDQRAPLIPVQISSAVLSAFGKKKAESL